ncbi:hypothetical protein RZS08_23425, partial [Arthrospira platensis SPKY1]|nr:hypothetical protein [Arthrospira platensis SPKY1]
QLPGTFTNGLGVVDADVDVRVPVQGDQHLIPALHVHVVEQQAHPNPAIGRKQQAPREIRRREVAVPDVILCVDASCRRLDQGRAQQEGLVTGIEKNQPRLSRVRFRHGPRQRAEFRLLGERECVLRDLVRWWRQGDATGQPGHGHK